MSAESHSKKKKRINSPNVDVSIVIPAFNESQRIVSSLHKIAEYISSKDGRYEVIVVDDGSTDPTVEVVRRVLPSLNARTKNSTWMVISVGQNKGKGSVVKRGMLAARGRMVLFSDADLSTPIGELDRLSMEMEKGCDVVIGSRAVRGSKITKSQPFYRVFMGKTYNMIVRSLTIRGIHDTQCGFKLFKKSVVVPIFSRQTIDGWGFDVEILYVAKKLGYCIKEIPVEWADDRGTKVTPLKTAFEMFFEIIHIRKMDALGRYR